MLNLLKRWIVYFFCRASVSNRAWSNVCRVLKECVENKSNIFISTAGIPHTQTVRGEGMEGVIHRGLTCAIAKPPAKRGTSKLHGRASQKSPSLTWSHVCSQTSKVACTKYVAGMIQSVLTYTNILLLDCRNTNTMLAVLSTHAVASSFFFFCSWLICVKAFRSLEPVLFRALVDVTC